MEKIILNKWFISEVKNGNEFDGTYCIWKNVESENGWIIGENYQHTQVYLCQDGVERTICITDVQQPYEKEAVLAEKKCGYFDTLKQAADLMREKKLNYELIREEYSLDLDWSKH